MLHEFLKPLIFWTHLQNNKEIAHAVREYIKIMPRENENEMLMPAESLLASNKIFWYFKNTLMQYSSSFFVHKSSP